MYTPTQNYGLAMPDYGDEADIGVINNMVTRKVDELLFQNRAISAPPFETTEAYTEGDLVVYENVLYRFTADKAAGAWDSSKVVQTSLAAEIEDRGSGASALSDLTDTDIDTPTDGEVLTYDGEKWVNAEGTPTVTKTATGNPIEITDGADAPLVKCVTQITGSQDLHGYDKPWVGGAGKNKFDAIGNTSTKVENGVTITLNSDGTVLINGTTTSISQIYWTIPRDTARTYAGMILNGNIQQSGVAFGLELASSPYTNFASDTGSGSTISEEIANASAPVNLILRISPNVTLNNALIKPMIRLSTETDPTFAPYSNICPITAYDEGKIEVSDGDGNTTTHTTTYPSAIYRGSEDVVNGEVTSEWSIYVINSFTGSAESNGFRTGIVLPNVSGAYGELYCNMFDRAGLYNEAVANEDLPNQRNKIGYNPNGVVLLNAYVNGAYVTTVQALNALLPPEGCVIAYKLATPTTSSVTPTNLPIKSLAGYSHIESSTGDMEIEYITEGYQPLVDLIDDAARQSMDIDSTTEQLVGKCADGSDKYKVTLTNIQLSAQNTTVDLSAYNVDTIVNYEGYVESSDHSVNRAFPYYNNSDYYANVYYVKADDELHIVSVGYSDYPYVTVTIFYKKKSTATTRTLAKGATEGLRAEISGVKGETEELTTTDEKAVKTAQSEDTETKENADETEENADEMQDETVTE